MIDLKLHLLSTSTSQNTKNLMSEVLKALFNIALELSHVSSESTARECSLLTSTLRKLILKYTPFTTEQSKELLTDIAHMLVNIPKEAMGSLLGDLDGAASIQEESSEVRRKHLNFVNFDSLNRNLKDLYMKCSVPARKILVKGEGPGKLLKFLTVQSRY